MKKKAKPLEEYVARLQIQAAWSDTYSLVEQTGDRVLSDGLRRLLEHNQKIFEQLQDTAYKRTQ